MPLTCPECGFANADAAKFCQNCGANLTGVVGPTTATYRIGETGEIEPIELDEVVSHGAALVVRSGGGRTGESFPLEGERMAVGRRPEAEVFLDDVTVSRDHALLVHRGDAWHIDDLGSLNGTYVNRRRIDSHKLADGDELQVGKYKLAFLTR